MAEAILKLVIEKLAGVVVQETLFLYGAKSKLDSLQLELQFIQAFLKDAESRRNSDERVKTWVNQVREVAYRIEDTIDMFIAEVDNSNRPGKLNALKRVLKNPKKLPVVHNLISEMDNIQTRLGKIKECIESYGIKKEVGDSGSSSSLLIRPVILPDEDDPDVVGLHKDKENIVNLLLDPNIKERRVVLIVGQGGLGKTTLARKAYNSDKVKEAFKFRLWLSISQQYKLIDLLKRILEKIRPLTEDEKSLCQKEDPTSQQRAREYFTIELNVSLRDRHYLIIMDDVWTEDLWFQMKEALPDVKNGSRVIVTSRFSEIVRRADPTCAPYEYELSYLSEEQSQLLLLKKAFPGQDSETYPYDELSDLPKKFAIKCGFLPLALVVVGGLLSRQSPTYNSWLAMFKKFSWHVNDVKKYIEILGTSYEDLPFHLKPCFMYFALFPEDYNIKAKSLIRMWVAEGFIVEEEGRTMEETAEDYLEELVQRSMIQVQSRYYNGSIRYCGIHDLLHDVAILKAKENGFLEIISNRDGRCSSSSMRRLSLHHYNREDAMKYRPDPNLRSLLYFGNYFPNLAACKLLRVLRHQIEYDNFANHFASIEVVFKELAQLRYLELPYATLISPRFYRRSFEINISLVRNLQTLDIRENEDLRAMGPQTLDTIWGIKTLRHVIVFDYGYCYGPPSTADLINLQTLKWVGVRKEWVTKGWPKMPNIRVLKLYGSNYSYWRSFQTFLSGLHHLTSVAIFTGDFFDDSLPPVRYSENRIIDMSVLPCYTSLQSLHVAGEWTSSKVTAHLFPIHLIKLKLTYSKIKEDPMPVLEKLASLKKLVLYDAYNRRQLCCSAGGFPQLQVLSLKYLDELEEWKVEEGAMPMLKKINIILCPKLRIIPRLIQMISLKNVKICLSGMSSDLYQNLREDESHKIRAGQFVHFDIQV